MESLSILNHHPNGVVIHISITSLRKSIFQQLAPLLNSVETNSLEFFHTTWYTGVCRSVSNILMSSPLLINLAIALVSLHRHNARAEDPMNPILSLAVSLKPREKVTLLMHPVMYDTVARLPRSLHNYCSSDTVEALGRENPRLASRRGTPSMSNA